MPPKKKAAAKKKKTVTTVVVKATDGKLPVLNAVDQRIPALLQAVVTSDVNSLKRLVSHYNFGQVLSKTDVNGSTPIHIAVKKNDLLMLENLLSFPTIAIDARELRAIGGHAALHHACYEGPTFLRVLNMLLASGANPNIKADSAIGETPLHLCCKFGHTQSARLLMKYGALGTVIDNFGNNAAHWAMRDKNERMIQELELPQPRAATAEEMFAIMKEKCPGFTLGKVPAKQAKQGKKDAAKGKKK